MILQRSTFPHHILLGAMLLSFVFESEYQSLGNVARQALATSNIVGGFRS